MKFELKKLAILTGAFAMAFASCDKNEPEPPREEGGKDLKASVLTIDPQNVVVDSSAAAAAAVTFNWTSAAEGADYTLYVAAYGESIFDGVVFDNGKDLSLTLSNGELNALALKEFGGVPGETVQLQAAVAASLGDESKTSAAVSFSVTLGAAEIIKPETLYMMGGALETGWDERVALPSTSEGVYRVENIVMKFGLPEDNRGFKFYVNETDDMPFYGQSTEAGAAFGDIVILYTGDSQFYPLHNGYESGVYTVEVNLNDLKLTLTKTSDVDEFIPSEYGLYIMGGSFGWVFTKDNCMTLVADTSNTYEIKHAEILPTTTFKFTTYGWGTEYVRNAESGEYAMMVRPDDTPESDVYFGLGTSDKPGYYTVKADLDALQVTLVLEQEIELPEYPANLYIFGEAAPCGWEIKDAPVLTPVDEGVYTVYDIELNFESDDEKGYGFKFSEINDWGGTEYGPKGNFEEGYRGLELDKTDRQFYPLLLGYESGTYDVTVNLKEMNITLTKK